MIGLVNVVRKLCSSFFLFYFFVSIYINNVGFVVWFVKKKYVWIEKFKFILIFYWFVIMILLNKFLELK